MGVRKSGTSLEAESADTVAVSLELLTGAMYYFNASKRASVGKVRRRFGEQIGFPTDRLRFICSGRRLADAEMMGEVS